MATIESTVEGKIVRRRVHITASDVVALGASTTGDIALGVQMPIGAKLQRVRVSNAGDAVLTLATLTLSVGDASMPAELLAAATVFASGAVGEAAPLLQFTAQTGVYPFVVRFTGNANLDTLTGGLGGFDVLLEWTEL